MGKEFQFLIYQSAEENVSVNAVIKDDTIWLTQKAMSELFGVQTPAISKHLKNIFQEGELDGKTVFGKDSPTTRDFFSNGAKQISLCNYRPNRC